MLNTAITGSLERFSPIGLDDIGSVRLMNRLEKKYLFSSVKLPDFLKLLPTSYEVLEINGLRIQPYSTMYLDTSDYLFYSQHVRGKLNRHKIRYRKYEVSGESFLEIKKKTNKGRTIKRRIESIPSDAGFDHTETGFISKYLPVDATLIKPALMNRFKRITLAGIDLMERITIDFDIAFSAPGSDNWTELPFLAVAEFKKEAYADFAHFRNLISELRIYPAGFSKYCIGSAMVHNNIKTNMLKPKLILLKKLENECI